MAVSTGGVVAIRSALPAQQYERLMSVMRQQRPLFDTLVQQHGSQSLLDYATAYYQSGLSEPQAERRDEFLKTLAAFAAERFARPTVNGLVAQLERYYTASTSDHHSPLFSSYAFQANVLTAAAYSKVNDPFLKYLLVLGCSSVSLNHRDFPRGLLYHTAATGELTMEHISLFPSRCQMHPVYGCPAYTEQQLTAALKQIEEKLRAATITPAVAGRLRHILRTHYGQPALLQLVDYVTQVSRLNYNLWQDIQPLTFASQLIYLDEEGLVTKLLLDHHLTNPTIVQRLLFNESVRTPLLTALAQAMGSYLNQGGAGTDLFWAITPEKHQRVALKIQGSVLVAAAADGSINIPLTADAIAAALRSKQIFPNLMLCYTVVCLYYQLNCSGGFNQMNYLAVMQRVYAASGHDALYRSAATQFMHYGLLSAFTVHGTKAQPLSGLDLWLYGDSGFSAQWAAALDRVTVAQAATWLAPAFYRYLPTAEQASFAKAELTKFIRTDSIERTLAIPAILSI